MFFFILLIITIIYSLVFSLFLKKIEIEQNLVLINKENNIEKTLKKVKKNYLSSRSDSSILQNKIDLILKTFDCFNDLQKFYDRNLFFKSIENFFLKNFQFETVKIFIKNLQINENNTIIFNIVKTYDTKLNNIINFDFLKKNYTELKTLSENIIINEKKFLVLHMPLFYEKKYIGVCILTQKTPVINSFNTKLYLLISQFLSIFLTKIFLFEKIDKMIIYDGLTNLFVHNYFKKKLKNEIQRSENKNSIFSLIIADIDNFKFINDTYGHQAGDEILKQISQIFLESCREIDIISRYGGDEFMFLLPNTEIKGAKILANRICKKIRNTEINFYNKKIKISLSLGCIQYNQKLNSVSKIIAEADENLYKAKKNGKNCVI